MAQLLIETRWHDRYRARSDRVDVGAGDAFLLVGRNNEDDLIGRIFLQDAVERPAVEHRHLHRLVASNEAGAREYDRFEQIAIVADAANAGQIGPDHAPDVADLVAGNALPLSAIEDDLPAANVAGRHFLEQQFQLFA